MPLGAKPRTSSGPRLNSSIDQQILPAPAGDVTGLAAHHHREVVRQRIVVASIDGRPDELDVTANAGKILLERRRIPSLGFRTSSIVL